MDDCNVLDAILVAASVADLIDGLARYSRRTEEVLVLTHVERNLACLVLRKLIPESEKLRSYPSPHLRECGTFSQCYIISRDNLISKDADHMSITSCCMEE